MISLLLAGLLGCAHAQVIEPNEDQILEMAMRRTYPDEDFNLEETRKRVQTFNRHQHYRYFLHRMSILGGVRFAREQIVQIEKMIRGGRRPDFTPDRDVARGAPRQDWLDNYPPQERWKYLRRVSTSLAFNLKSIHDRPDDALELKAIATALLAEASDVIESAGGRPERVAHEAAKIWGWALTAEFLAGMTAGFAHQPQWLWAIAPAMAGSLYLVAHNVRARAFNGAQPLFYRPGAYDRSAREVSTHLWRYFWEDVGNNVKGWNLPVVDDIEKVVRGFSEGELPDLKQISCSRVLAYPIPVSN